MADTTSSEAAGGERKAGHAVVHAGHDHDEEHGHDHAHHAHPYLQHHFDTPQQQFDAGKLGIWLFLVQEVLFFSGLFCAYTVYRSQYPEVFNYAHYYLDTNLGALNTIVLIFSSLTAAWAVRCAQLNNKKGLVTNIALTIACACTFLVVKYFEYSHKFHDGLLWGNRFNPAHAAWELPAFQEKHPEAAELARKLAERAKAKDGAAAAVSPLESPPDTDSAGRPAGPAAAEAAPGADQAAGDAQAGAAAPATGGAAEGAPASEQAAAAPAAGASEGAPAAEATADAQKQGSQELDAQTGMRRTDPEAVATPGMEGAKAARDAAQERRSDAAGPGPEAEQARAGGAQIPEGTDPSGAAPPPPAPGDAAEAQPAQAQAPADAVPAPDAVDQAAAAAKPAEDHPLRTASEAAIKPLVAAGILGDQASLDAAPGRPSNVHVFFGIYFFMTGLHGIHVLAGIIVWVWLLFRATKGQFGQDYFGPIDYAALYWHLVDLIWIYLFPLLYLIH